MNTLTEKQTQQIARDKIVEFEGILASHPEAMFGNCFPLKHEFADGLYIRTIYTPKNALIVTKLFKQEHATFLLKGECSVVTDEGIKRIKAPYRMVTKVGTKRVIFCHEDVEWTTVHHNIENTQDVEKLENIIIADSPDEIEFTNDEKELLQMGGAV